MVVSFLWWIPALSFEAFDLIQLIVLLNHLFDAGIDGKGWRLLKSCYTKPTASVHSKWSLIRIFHDGEMCCQGSVLSLLLFSLVLDPSWERCKKAKQGCSSMGCLPVLVHMQTTSEQSQTAGTTSMPSFRWSTAMPAPMIWNWMWKMWDTCCTQKFQFTEYV